MPTWKLRSPEAFPPYFANAVRQVASSLDFAQEPRIRILANASLKACKSEADRFRWYRFCLRHHPLHPLHSAEMGFILKTSIEPRQDSKGNPIPELADLWIVAKRRISASLLQSALNPPRTYP